MAVKRLTVFAAILAALAIASPALAAKQMIAVQNTQAFKGYTTFLTADKDSARPANRRVNINVAMFKGDESHIYSFRAAANALVVATNLSSATLRLNAVTPKGQSGAALAALGSYGHGTLHFVQNAPLNTPSCTGGTKKTRRVTRDSGSMTFSPTRNATNRYTRQTFNGTIQETTGTPVCGPPPPAECDHYTQLSSSSGFAANGQYKSVTASKPESPAVGKANVSFLFIPPTAPLAPAYGAAHIKTAKVDRSRFTNATNLSTATLNLAGVPEWGGVLEFDATSAMQSFPDCDREKRSGGTTGATRAKFDFLGWVAHNGHPTFASLERQ